MRPKLMLACLGLGLAAAVLPAAPASAQCLIVAEELGCLPNPGCVAAAAINTVDDATIDRLPPAACTQ